MNMHQMLKLLNWEYIKYYRTFVITLKLSDSDWLEDSKILSLVFLFLAIFYFLSSMLHGFCVCVFICIVTCINI